MTWKTPWPQYKTYKVPEGPLIVACYFSGGMVWDKMRVA